MKQKHRSLNVGDASCVQAADGLMAYQKIQANFVGMSTLSGATV
jgi:hypothetical protein